MQGAAAPRNNHFPQFVTASVLSGCTPAVTAVTNARPAASLARPNFSAFRQAGADQCKDLRARGLTLSV
jgi:hypothetical protein